MKHIKNYFRMLDSFLQSHSVLNAFLPILGIAFPLTLIISCFSLCDPLGGLKFLFANPICFFLNLLILFTTLSIASLFPHRYFGMTLVCVIWLLLGITDWIMMLVRNSPLAGNDFQVFFTGFDITIKYLSVWQMALIVIGLILLVIGMILLFKKIPRRKAKLLPMVVTFFVSCIFLSGLVLTVRMTGFIPDHFDNMPECFDKYGFVYCFTQSLVDRGVARPEDYSDQSIDDILNSLENQTAEQPESKPNIVYLQLESFLDVNEINSVTFSENPIPTFTALCNNGISGQFSVPSVGGGTANTEFEVLTGMSLDYFGVGEYPYYTILQEKACESIAYNLSSLGYTSHAIHNHSGSFYQRNTAYANLGFDTFTPLEYMVNPSFNPLGWTNDSILTGEILQALQSTDGTDFVFTVSVQGHGKYPSEPLGDDEPIKVYGISDSSLACEYQYYVNQLHEMDTFLAQLIQALSEYPEDVVLVVYGDHLPALEIHENEMSTGSLYQTEYAVWSNYGLQGDDKDLDAYRLSAYIFSLLGYHTGTLMQFHSLYQDKTNYQPLLEMLEYDMLYGSYQIYGGSSPYQTAAMSYGTNAIRITGAVPVGNDLYLTGENFTKYSYVFINGHERKTDCLSDTLIRLSSLPADGSTITIRQITDTAVTLGESEAFVYKKSD